MADLISRADAIEWVKKICWNCSNTICINLINAFKALPTASADRPHGEWIKQDKYFQAFNETVTTYKCSVCGHEPYFGGDISKLNYCPNCGADMRGEQNE